MKMEKKTPSKSLLTYRPLRMLKEEIFSPAYHEEEEDDDAYKRTMMMKKYFLFLLNIIPNCEQPVAFFKKRIARKRR
jgi:hypothetical protein